MTTIVKDYRVGDAFDLIRAIPNDSVDLVITSPPYWGLRTYGIRHNWNILDEWEANEDRWNPPPYKWYRAHGGALGLEPLPDWYIHHLVEFFALCRSKIKKSGSIWVNIGDTYFARWASIRDSGRQGLGNNSRIRRRVPMGRYLQEKQLLLIPSRFAIQMQSDRWILRNDLIWSKPNVPPRPEKDRLRLAHEHFFHFVHKPKEGRAKYLYDLSQVEDGARDVVEVNVKNGGGNHSATFPPGIIMPRIMSSSPKAGTVLDPFCGSGSAVECAFKLGRNTIGFDVVSKYIPKQ